MIYASSTLALAALELLMHLDIVEAPDDLVTVPITIPASVSIEKVAMSRLPGRWREYPAPEDLAELGATWALGGGTAVLAVPSAIIPHELNYIVNPRHAGFRAIAFGTLERFSFDPTAWR